MVSKFAKKNHLSRVVLQSNTRMTVKLSDLQPGERGIIKEFRDNEISLKLMEMGCVPGESIIMEQKAPLGDPISINVSGYHLSLRLDEAEQIIIDVIY